MNGKGCIVFDLDGTLIDSRLDLVNTVNMTRKVLGLEPLPLETAISFVGHGIRNLLERSLEGTGIPADDSALEIMQTAYRANLNLCTTLYPGVYAGQQKLSAAGWKLAVLSNKPEDFCKFILYDLGVGTMFNLIIGDSEGFPLKPDPAGLEFVLETLRIDDPSSCWMVGDSATDLEAGRRAGVKRAYASYGFGDPKTESWDLKLEKFEQLTEKLA